MEDVIHNLFLPAITGQNAFSDDDRDLMALPARLGGLGIIDPSCQAASQFRTGEEVTAPFAAFDHHAAVTRIPT